MMNKEKDYMYIFNYFIIILLFMWGIIGSLYNIQISILCILLLLSEWTSKIKKDIIDIQKIRIFKLKRELNYKKDDIDYDY